MRLSSKVLSVRRPVLSSLLSHRHLPVKLTGEAAGYPIHKGSILAAIELTVFEESFLCYSVISLKIAGNN
jgi:hypothetical protein